MSVPFSNTNLRVPHGFSNILEGLAREVLREQPDDIPTFAAVYFTALLKQRDESGLDPAEWGARLEDRFYNNHAFKIKENQGNSSSTKVTQASLSDEDKVDRAESFGNEDEFTQPTQNSWPSSENTDNDAKAQQEVQESEEASENKADDESGESDPVITPEVSFRGTADVDICAEGLKETEETGEIRELEKETGEDGKEKEEEEELKATPLTSYSGFVDVDVCAEELQSSTLQADDDESAYEDTEGRMGLIDAHPALEASESPKPVQGEEELSRESGDVLDSHDKFIETLSGAESPRNVEQEVSDTEELSVFLPVEEAETKEETDDPSQNTLSEMTDDLLEDGDKENSHLEEFKNSNEAFEDDNDQVDQVLSTDHLQFASETTQEEDDENYPSPEAPVDESMDEGLMVSNTSLIDEDDPIISQQDVPKIEDSREDQSMNDTEMKEDDVTTQDAEEASNSPTPEEAAREEAKEDSTEVIYEEQTEETETYLDQEEGQSEHQDISRDISKDISQNSTLQTEDKEEEEDPENKREGQEECGHPQEEEDIMDIPLDDPEANKAAAKIQAGFRGHMTRKKMKPGEKPGEEVSSSGETLNGSQGDTAGGSEGVETEDTSVPEQ